jgi:hypothetical protein
MLCAVEFCLNASSDDVAVGLAGIGVCGAAGAPGLPAVFASLSASVSLSSEQPEIVTKPKPKRTTTNPRVNQFTAVALLLKNNGMRNHTRTPSRPGCAVARNYSMNCMRIIADSAKTIRPRPTNSANFGAKRTHASLKRVQTCTNTHSTCIMQLEHALST